MEEKYKLGFGITDSYFVSYHKTKFSPSQNLPNHIIVYESAHPPPSKQGIYLGTKITQCSINSHAEQLTIETPPE